MRLSVLVLLGSLCGCTPWLVLGEKPDPVELPVSSPPALVSTEPQGPPLPAPDPTPPVVTYIRQVTLPPPEPPQEPAPVVAKTRMTASKGPSAPTPQQLIQEAQHEARVAPAKRGYFGSSGVQRYLWMPGKIYDVYLTPSTGTKLVLPPGEVLAHALILNPKSFEVSSATVGSELTASSVMLLRPCGMGEVECVPVSEVDVALTSVSGRGYNLHLIVGKVGMVEVTWELTPVPLVEVAEPGMLPRRQP